MPSVADEVARFPLAKEEAVPRISVSVDGVRHEHDVESRLLLVHYLRDHAGKVGTVVGCDTSNCWRLYRPTRRPERKELFGASRSS